MHSIYRFLFFFVTVIYGFSLEEISRVINCVTPCSNETCEDACNYLVNSFNYYPQLNEDANSSVTLHCADITHMKIKYNPGIYLIQQSLSEDVWNRPQLRKGTLTTFRNLTAGTPYRYRLHRLMKNGISQSETSDWFSTYDVEYQPQDVKNVSLSKIEVDEKNICQLRAKIAFEPAQDRSCSYVVLFWYGEHRLVNFRLKEINDFQFELKHLNYGQSNNVSVSSSNQYNTKKSNETSITFITPSCLEVHNNLSICAPEQVEGLRIEYSYGDGILYDAIINWDKPKREPYVYTIQVDLLQNEESVRTLSVPGNVTQVTIPNLELGPQYEVSIIAESPGGASLATSISTNLIDIRGTTNKFYRELLIGLLIVLLIFIVVGVICLQYYRHRNKNLAMEYTNFESRNQKDSSIAEIKKLSTDYGNERDDDPLIRDKFDLCPKLLKLKGILGSGAYGVVRLGLLKDQSNKVTHVAVKMLKENPSLEDINNIEHEIFIMKSVGKHPNIVSLIGCYTLHDKPVLVVEYCCKGDLQSYLRTIWQNMVNLAFDHRARFRFDSEACTDSGIEHSARIFGGKELDYQNVQMIANRLYDIQQDVTQSTENVTASDLLNFARQIVTGMEFLSSNRIVHRDLAARNVLVCADRIVKISDFGLSRDVYQENLYRKQGSGKLPLKWMAIEALTHQIYTTYSDIWSFGILLWEIVTIGALPYPGIPADAVLRLLKHGYRMERPLNCSVELYNIMLSCWNDRPQSRPTFTELKERLDELLSSYSENKYLNMNEILCNHEDQYRMLPEN